MKIIQVQTQAEAAGAQRVSDMVGEGLRLNGHEVTTVFLYRKTDVYDTEPHVHFIREGHPASPFGMMGAVLGLWRHLRAERPDAVITYQHFGNVAGAVGARLAGARVVANQSGAPFRGGLPGLASLVDRWFGALGVYDSNVVNSSWTEEQFATYPPSYRKRMVRIDHGVLPPPALLDRAQARREFGLPPEARLIVSSGRLTRIKNFAALVRCLPLLPQLHLAVAGVGPEQAAIVALAAQEGVAGRLHLVGEVPPDGIHRFLAAGDLYVYASTLETFGLAVAEAAVSGLPVVSNDLPVLREVLADEAGQPAALFADAEDSAGFAAAIARLLDEPALARELAAAGLRMRERFSPARMAQAYEDLLVGPGEG